MTRRFLDDVRADINALLVTAGDTKAPDLAALMIDTIDSSIEDESVIYSTAPTPALPTSATWQAVAGASYGGSVGGDGDFLKTDFATGTIGTTSQAGFTYTSEGFVSFTDLGANVVIEFTVLKNGAPVGSIATITGGGNNRPRTINFSAIDLSNSPDDSYQVAIQTPAGAQTIELLEVALAVVIKPTNNP